MARASGAFSGTDSGFVRRSGRQLTLNGKPYRFVGLNMYSATTNFSFSWGCGVDDTATIAADLTSLRPYQNVVRSWFFQQMATVKPANGGPSRNWTAFDLLLDSARARNIKVIPVLGDQWGDCEATTGSVEKIESWYAASGGNTGYKLTPMNADVNLSYRDWVSQVVTRYKDRTEILMWQMMNEAEIKVAAGGACGSSATLKTWADDIAALIKSIDTNHLVCVGSLGIQQCGILGDDYQTLHSGSNIDICEYHDYAYPSEAMPTGSSKLSHRLTQAAALGKPIFVGEMAMDQAEANRTTWMTSKINTQFAQGVAGYLLWNWVRGASPGTWYEIGLNDPVLPTLAAYRTT